MTRKNINRKTEKTYIMTATVARNRYMYKKGDNVILNISADSAKNIIKYKFKSDINFAKLEKSGRYSLWNMKYFDSFTITETVQVQFENTFYYKKSKKDEYRTKNERMGITRHSHRLLLC